MIAHPQGFIPVLRNRHFLRLWLAQILSQVAQSGVNLVQIVLIENLTHSSGPVALMVLAFTLPGVLLSLFAGVAVDRVSNRAILIASNVLRALFTLGYLVAIWSHWSTVTTLSLIYAITFVTASIGNFFAPAELVTIPLIVKKESLLSANALFKLTESFSQMIGLVLLFPFVIKLGNAFGPGFGIELSFIVVSAMYGLAGLLVAFLPPDSRTRPQQNYAVIWREAQRDIREGWQFVKTRPGIYWPITHLTVGMMLLMILATVGPGYASRVLELAPEDAIFIFAPLGLGMLFSLFLIRRLGQHFRRDLLSNTGLFVVSVALLGLALIGWLKTTRTFSGFDSTLWAMGLSLFLGLSFAFIAVPAQTSLQTRSPIDLRGRVFSLLYMVSSLVVIPPLLFIGALADRIGIPNVLLLVVVINVTVGIVALARDHTIVDAPTLIPETES